MLLAYALSLSSHPRRDRSCCFGADRCGEPKDASHGRAGGASRNRTGATRRSTTGLREHWTFLFRLVAGRVSVSIILSLTFLLAVLCKAATLPALGVLVVFEAFFAPASNWTQWSSAGARGQRPVPHI